VGFEAAGFQVEPGSAVALIESERTNEVVFALTPEPATLVLTCDAPNAVSEIEDRKSSIANPLTVPSLVPLTVTVTAPDHRAQTLRLGPFDPLSRQQRAVTLEREAGALRVVARVEGVAAKAAAPYLAQARVRLDGGEWRASALPHTVERLPCREHEVSVEVEDFSIEPGSRRVVIRDARTVEAAFVLRPEPARLTVLCPAGGAEVFDAGGKRLGAAGEALTLASLQPLTLSVRAPGHVAGALRLRPLEPGKAYRHKVELQPDAAPAAAAGPEAGKARTVDLGGGVRMEFVWIKALKLWVGKYEVTNEQYRRKEPGHDSKQYKGNSLNGDRQPVVYVNFDDAKAYAQWLTEQERRSGSLPAGYRYRLPSEAEWMTFAQCGDGREYPWGNNWPPRSGQAGNYSDSASAWRYKIDGYNDGHPVTCDVEKSWANPWGLYGVGGNVWECCAKDNSGGAFGAWRGASWDHYGQGTLRCACRYGNFPSYRDDYDGFRLVLSRP